MNICPECGLNVELGFHMIGCSQYDSQEYEEAASRTVSSTNAKALQESIQDRTISALRTYITSSLQEATEKWGLNMTESEILTAVEEVISNATITSTINLSYVTTVQILQEQGLINEQEFVEFVRPHDSDDL